MSKQYGKIYCEEGVIKEREFDSWAEAVAYAQGFYDTLEALDIEDDFHHACADIEPAKDEQPQAPSREE